MVEDGQHDRYKVHASQLLGVNHVFKLQHKSAPHRFEGFAS